MKFSKKDIKADLKEYSNEATKGINDFIVQHPKVMEVVIDAAKRATDEKSFTDWLQEALTGEGMEEGVRKEVKWEELGWAWFNTVNRETTEPTSTDVIQNLPTLDKPKKIDELLEQLSIETDPDKKEQIKQHIERIKRGSLKQADELGEPAKPYPPEEEGKQEISIYHPAYEFLVRLIKLLSKTVPEAIPEIKQISQSSPFKTVDDIGDLTAKIWTLATTKYNVPREWLISKLPEKKIKGSLDKKAGTLDIKNSLVYFNPTELQANGLLEKDEYKSLRGLIDPLTGDLYLWGAGSLIHQDVMNYLGITVEDITNVHLPLDLIITTSNQIRRLFLKQQQFKASLGNEKKADLWPAQEASEVTLTQSPGAIAYNNPKDTSVSGPNPNDVVDEDKLWSMVVDEFFTAHKRWSEVVKAIRSTYPNVSDSLILSLKDRVKKSLDNQMGMIGSLKKKANWWSSSSGRIELDMTLDQAESVSGQGQHDEDAKYLVKELRPQLDKIDPQVLASELKEYGAWDDKELADHEENLQRLVWIAGNDVSEHEFEEENKEVDVDIENLPTLDKKQRIDELLEQLSKEVNPQKQQQIKQHIERIKRASRTAKHHLNMDQVIKILDSKDSNKVDHINFIDNTIELIDGTKLTFDEATKRAVELDKEGTFQGSEFSNTDWCVNPVVNNPDPFASPEDQGAKPQKHPFPNSNWLPFDDSESETQPSSNVAGSLKQAHCGPCTPLKLEAIKRFSDFKDKHPELKLDQILASLAATSPEKDISNFLKTFEEGLKLIEADPKLKGTDEHRDLSQVFFSLSEIQKHLEEGTFKAAFSKKELYKQANPPSRMWLAPDGTEFSFHMIHPVWIDRRHKILNNMDLDSFINSHGRNC